LDRGLVERIDEELGQVLDLLVELRMLLRDEPPP
jgi:hypothetical protein